MRLKDPIFGLIFVFNVCFSTELTIQQQLNQLNRRVASLENDVRSLKGSKRYEIVYPFPVYLIGYIVCIYYISYISNIVCMYNLSYTFGVIIRNIFLKKENADYKSLIENKEVEDDIQYLLAQNEEVKTKIDSMESRSSSDSAMGDVNVNFSGMQIFRSYDIC